MSTLNGLETRMRRGEWFHSLTIPPNAYAVLRVDGRSFSRLTEVAQYKKPFDERFASFMWRVAERLLTEFSGVYAYVESDEISVLLPRSSELFNREVEKLVSLSAAIVTAVFNREAPPVGDLLPTFDSRVWVGVTDDDAVDYFLWRYDDAYRCAVNGWAYWTLRKEGVTARAATSMLSGLRTPAKHDLLFERGVNVNDLLSWQKRGVGLWWEHVTVTGHNPITGEDVEALRRRVRIEAALPQSRDEYREMLRERFDVTSRYPDGVLVP